MAKEIFYWLLKKYNNVLIMLNCARKPLSSVALYHCTRSLSWAYRSHITHSCFVGLGHKVCKANNCQSRRARYFSVRLSSFIRSLVDWLVDWLIGLLVGWLIDWMVDRSVGRLIGWMIVWLNDKLIDSSVRSFARLFIRASIHSFRFYFVFILFTMYILLPVSII